MDKKYTVTIDLGDILHDAFCKGHCGVESEKPLPSVIRKEIIKSIEDNCLGESDKDVISDLVNKKFIEKANEAIDKNISSIIDSFVKEEISITDTWGKVKFVGTVEDLIKEKFDEKILAPVDMNGKKLSGCTTSSRTYIDYIIDKAVDGYVSSLDKLINSRILDIKTQVEDNVKKQLEDLSKNRIVDIVSGVVASLDKK